MGAYAPLLARYGFTQWPRANLIWFNNETVVRTPNYYIQQLFATRLGDRYLGNKVEFVGDNPSAVLAISPTLATKAGKVYVKLVNPMARSVRAAIRLEGVNGIAPEAELVELAADKDAGNSLTDPGRVAPQVKKVAAGNRFSLEVPPCSVQVLTLDLVAGKKQD
jgi:alpha-L-arabinofuranosidase